VAAITRHFGKLDVLVNNSGISRSAEQDFYSTEAWHRIMAVNATGVFCAVKNAVPARDRQWRRVDRQSVGNCRHHWQRARAHGLQRLEGRGPADDQIGRGAARQGQDPRQLGSSRRHAADAHIWRTADPAVRTERMRFILMRRPGEVDEVAYAILFLASDESSYITGSEIHVDGGAQAI